MHSRCYQKLPCSAVFVTVLLMWLIIFLPGLYINTFSLIQFIVQSLLPALGFGKADAASFLKKLNTDDCFILMALGEMTIR